MCHSLFGGICPVAILNILNSDIPIAATLATMETLQGVGVVNHIPYTVYTYMRI